MTDQSTRTRLLFVFHDAGRTGASIVLLRYVKWLHQQQGYELFFLLRSRGPLEQELAQLGKLFYWTDTPPASRLKRYAGNVLRRLGSSDYRARLLKQLSAFNIRLIYANTIVCADMIASLKHGIGARVAWHIHELELADRLLKLPVADAVPLADFFVANSQHTAGYLRKQYNVSSGSISVHYPPLPAKYQSFAPAQPSPWPGKFVVGSAGTALTQKGAELFVVLAALVRSLDPANDLQFVWVGNPGKLKEELAYDLRQSGLGERVQFVGEHPSPEQFYAHFDIFISLSKEESFGLACLEAAALEKPVAGFCNAGGIGEILEGCGGLQAPYLDLLEVARRLLELRKDTEQLRRMGAQSKAYAAGFTEQLLLPEWKKYIDRISS